MQLLIDSIFRVLGPPALQHFAKHWEPLPTATRPIYNFSMKGVITCFTGIRKREELVSKLNIQTLCSPLIRLICISLIVCQFYIFLSIAPSHRHASST